MDRKKFIYFNSLGFATLIFSPSSLFASDRKLKSLSSAHFFKHLYNCGKSIDASKLHKFYEAAFNSLIKELDRCGYIYDSNELIKLNENCYALPVLKKSLFKNAFELALISTENNKPKYVLLDETLTKEFNNFNQQFKQGFIASNSNEGDTTYPFSFVKSKDSNNQSFNFKNKYGNIISLKKFKQKSYILIN